MGVFASSARVLHVLLLGIWLGAIGLYFALGGSLFEVLGSRHVAAQVLAAALARIDAFGLLAGPVLLLTLFSGWAGLRVPLRWRAGGTLLMTASAALSGRYLTPRLMALEAAMGRPVDDLAAADPLVLQYLMLQRYSAAALTLTAALALWLLVVAVRQASPRRLGGIEL